MKHMEFTILELFIHPSWNSRPLTPSLLAVSDTLFPSSRHLLDSYIFFTHLFTIKYRPIISNFEIMVSHHLHLNPVFSIYERLRHGFGN